MLSKKSIGLIIFIVLVYLVNDNRCCGQDSKDMLLIETKLWNEKGDTITGLIDYINQYNLQFNLTIIDTVTGVIKYYSPRDIAGFSFKVNTGEAVFYSVENPFNIGRVFLKAIYQGQYSVYQYLELDQRSSILSFIVHFYLRKEYRVILPEPYLPYLADDKIQCVHKGQFSCFDC